MNFKLKKRHDYSGNICNTGYSHSLQPIKKGQMTRHVLTITTLILSTLNSFGQCSISFTQTDASCFGYCDVTGLANPTGTSPFTYAWTTGDTTQMVTGLCAGTYILTLTDSTGCIAVDSLTINEPTQLIATITLLNNPSDSGMCDAEVTISATGGTIPYTYQWYDCANDTPITGPMIPPYYFCAGEWGIIIVDSNGCADTSCVTVTDPPLAIETLTSHNNLTYQLIDRSIIFSRPIKEIRIIDALGHLVFNSTGRQVNQVDLPDLPTGLYILTTKTTKGQQLTDKLIIKREKNN